MTRNVHLVFVQRIIDYTRVRGRNFIVRYGVDGVVDA